MKRYILATPDHNWYGPYPTEERAQEELYDMRHRYVPPGDWKETRPLKVTTIDMDTLNIEWPKWR